MDKEINRRITYYRKKCGLSQREVAIKLGMKMNAYSRAEREGNIPCDMAMKLAEIFEIDIKFLLYNDPTDDEIRLAQVYGKELDFENASYPVLYFRDMSIYEKQLFSMFRRCNIVKQKLIMECAYAIFKAGNS